jgi:hypothetical protein
MNEFEKDLAHEAEGMFQSIDLDGVDRCFPGNLLPFPIP